MYAPYVVGSNRAGFSSLTHSRSGLTSVSKFGSQKNAALSLTPAPVVTTRCLVDLNTPFVHRSHKSPTLHTNASATAGTGTHASSEPPLADATAAEDPAGDHAAVAQKSSPLFDIDRLQTCVDHANAVTATYGVSIISINIAAAVPSDRTLQSSLAQGAVAAAEAQKVQTVARGRASAALIEARGLAESETIRARGEAEATKIKAEGAKKAADLLESSDVAVKLAVIEKTGAALSDKSTVFFGADAKNLDAMLGPAVVAAATRAV